MATDKIYAKDFLKKFDFYHLAKQFYRHIYRHPELEVIDEWKELKLAIENYLVEQRFNRCEKPEMTPEDYLEFLQFYTGLEVKYEEPDQEFIFTNTEKKFFEKILKIR